MNTSVDVLAVMASIWHQGLDETNVRDFEKARAAVAELIEAVDKHLFAIRQMDEAMNDGINVQGAVSGAIGTEEMLRAALAGVKGA